MCPEPQDIFTSAFPGSLFLAFGTYLVANRIGRVLAIPGLIFSEFDAVIPDIVFFTHKTAEEIVKNDRLRAAPDIVIEILSPGLENERRDRVAKKRLYADFGVGEYWIVDAERRSIEVYSPPSVSPTMFRPEDSVTSSLLPGFSFKVASIFED